MLKIQVKRVKSKLLSVMSRLVLSFVFFTVKFIFLIYGIRVSQVPAGACCSLSFSWAELLLPDATRVLRCCHRAAPSARGFLVPSAWHKSGSKQGGCPPGAGMNTSVFKGTVSQCFAHLCPWGTHWLTSCSSAGSGIPVPSLQGNACRSSQSSLLSSAPHLAVGDHVPGFVKSK